MLSPSSTATALVAALLILGGAPAAFAAQAPESAPAAPGERPWAKGVPQEAQDRAVVLFKAGNALLKDSVFAQAAAKYREALRHWDHPAIHYNLVLALLNMDQPVEVNEHLQKAMQYGPEPLDADKYDQARSYKALVEKQLARVEIRCDVEGAQVVMDGRPLFVAPGHYEAYVRPGPHSIVATKEGYLTNEQSKALPAGETTEIDLKLFTAADLTQYKRRWSVWTPWSVVGAGAAVALVGGGLHYGGVQDVRAFDSGVEACGGCVPTPDLDATRRRGQTMQKIGVGGYALGGAALVTGAVLVYMNRLQPYHINAAEVPAQQQTLTVAPMLGGETRGLWAVLQF